MDLGLPFLIGVGLALGAFVLGRVVGLDRDRAFYTTALIVIAALYDLFAVMGGSTKALPPPCWASGATFGSSPPVFWGTASWISSTIT